MFEKQFRIENKVSKLPDMNKIKITTLKVSNYNQYLVLLAIILINIIIHNRVNGLKYTSSIPVFRIHT